MIVRGSSILISNYLWIKCGQLLSKYSTSPYKGKIKLLSKYSTSPYKGNCMILKINNLLQKGRLNYLRMNITMHITYYYKYTEAFENKRYDIVKYQNCLNEH